MKLLGMPYRATAVKAAVSGLVGVWVHVFIDNLFHPDVQMFWPSRARPLRELMRRNNIRLGQEEIEFACIVLTIGAVLMYIMDIVVSRRKKH